DGAVHGSRAHLVERLGLGPRDLLLGELRAPLEALSETLTGFLGERLGLAPGLRDDGARLLLGLAPLALIVGKELLGFLAQPARLIELAANRVRAVVERPGDHARNPVVDQQADEAEEGDGNPELG